MASASSRPPIPRPTARPSSVPPPAPRALAEPKPEPTAEPKELESVLPASAPRQVAELPKAYASEPPVIRERMPTLEIADGDIVEAAEAAPVTRSSAPPPPPSRKSSAPPPPPESRIVLKEPAKAAPAPVVPPAPAIPTELRGSAPDPTDLLFDGMYELNFVDTPWQAAGVCATALANALGARSVVIHAHDLARREIRAIGGHGANAADLLGATSSSDDDFVASTVMCNGKPLVMRIDGELPRLAPERLGVLGAKRSFVAVPALSWGRCVALIEIVDADDRLVGRVADSAAYVAERLAEFLLERAAA